MINELFTDAKHRMDQTIEHYHHEITSIRTGRASVNILDMIKADYYGTPTPIKNMAQISVPEPQMIVIQPFDPGGAVAIEKAIFNSDLGLNPNNDGKVIRLNIPALTDERRKDLVRLVHKMIEEGRIAVRNVRRDINDQLKTLNKDHQLSDDNLKRALDDIQEMTNSTIEELNKIQDAKEKEILE
ncbi:MAG: ribosome recycling factor [Candidatus Marinimicrobia bacterium]|nr:ribosome recycling factor [Candidatus Neomarinimicrobiota bacterium]MBL7023245.1 ribosome recycling factor [Candidatus Neomarinimicrobiota bacterium]MBL7110031.1 ribosome recycling factor [Candidatus Neomarinimicrobiota bacterium]